MFDFVSFSTTLLEFILKKNHRYKRLLFIYGMLYYYIYVLFSKNVHSNISQIFLTMITAILFLV